MSHWTRGGVRELELMPAWANTKDQIFEKTEICLKKDQSTWTKLAGACLHLSQLSYLS